MQTKICKTCGQNLKVDSFYKAKQGKFGVRASCKDCEGKKQSFYRSSSEQKDRISLYNKAYPKDKKLSAQKAWVKSNYDYVLSYNASRRQLSKRATFVGYKEEIEVFYWMTRDLRAVTGEEYHVDHIVPLKGESVCGLHVPWNLQILPSDINMSKSNNFDPAIKEDYDG